MAEGLVRGPRLYKGRDVWWIERCGSAYREHFHDRDGEGRPVNWKFNNTPMKNKIFMDKKIRQRKADGWSEDA